MTAQESAQPKAFETSLMSAGVVRTRIWVPVSRELVLQSGAAALALARKAGSVRFLVDMRGCRSLLSTVEHFRLAHEDARKLGVPRGARLALLVSPGDDSHDFMETVARNAGYECRVMRDETEALDWVEG